MIHHRLRTLELVVPFGWVVKGLSYNLSYEDNFKSCQHVLHVSTSPVLMLSAVGS